MRISTDLLDHAAASVRAQHGVETRELEGDGLYRALSAACELLSVARLVAAPLAAAADRLSGPAELRGGFARAAGHRTAEHLVASLLGGTLADARKLIEAGLAMDPDPQPDDADDDGPEDDPEPDDGPEENENEKPQPKPSPKPRPIPGPPPGSLAEALTGGLISVDAAALIRRTLSALMDACIDTDSLWAIEQRLVAKAKRVALKELRAACLWEQASADPEGWKRREKRQRAERHVSLREESDGMFTLHGRLDPLSAAALLTFFDGHVKSVFQSARDARVTEERTPGQIRVDALSELAAHALGCTAPRTGATTTVVVTVGYETLRDELGFANVGGVGAPVSASELRRLAVEAQLLPVVLGGHSEVLDIGRAARPFTAAQRRALVVRDGGCAWCGAAPSWCEAHHLVPWGQGGPTDLANGVLLCRSCHLRIHDTQWTVEIHGPTVWFRPPATVDPDRRPLLGGRRRTEPRDLPPEPNARPGLPLHTARARHKPSAAPSPPPTRRREQERRRRNPDGLFDVADPRGP